MKSLALVTGTEFTRKSLLDQLAGYLGDIVELRSYAVDQGISEKITADLILLSTELIFSEARNFLDPQVPLITARRTVNYSSLDKILFLPGDTDVLFVNDIRETTLESIESLKNLGLNHLNFYPYYPAIKEYKPCKIAITPGEIDKIPSSVDQVINIGPRLIDMTTMTEVLTHLQLLDQKAEHVSHQYIKKIIELGRRLVQSSNETNELNNHLKTVMDSINNGILVFDQKGKVTIINENLKKILRHDILTPDNKQLSRLINNRELRKFLLEEKGDGSNFFNVGGNELLVNRIFLKREKLYITIFKNTQETIEMEKRLRRELIKKGYYAKYTFADIIGKSRGILKAKDIGKKLAGNDLTILIEGESGTGKELFASSIHNYSRRSDGPFLAINFSALPDNLVESELFGYEGGAFTGARREGKIGLFEQANGGTIFLDEIGDISLKVQARLLRVLEEKEIMRVGGDKIIPIDVRIIAATNKNLLEMINQDRFREDLYHRLKVLYLQLPPLRKRGDDLVQLFNYFLREQGGQRVIVEDKVLERLKKYNWSGNIRELRNTVNYLLTVCSDNRITVEHIPEAGFFQKNKQSDSYQQEKRLWYENLKTAQPKIYLLILSEIAEITAKGGVAGRKKLSQRVIQKGYSLTENQIRYRLVELEQAGFIIRKRGRFGTRLTPDGRKIIKKSHLSNGV